MAIGDAAAAAGMAVVDGATTPAHTIDTEINRSRDYIATGMGATDAPVAGKVVKRNSAAQAQFGTPTAAAHAATKGYADAGDNAVRAYVDGRVVPITTGGTGATDVAGARTALDVTRSRDTVRLKTAGGSQIQLRWQSGRVYVTIDGADQPSGLAWYTDTLLLEQTVATLLTRLNAAEKRIAKLEKKGTP